MAEVLPEEEGTSLLRSSPGAWGQCLLVREGEAMKDYDDKDLVIVAVMILGIVAMFALPDAKEVVSSIVAGLFGVAVGRKV